jgi:oligopeptide/dipeptide ABC transporter ATP-binding protein
MRQRVMIAMALACRPELVIADEPVTALDVMIQAQIMELLRDLSRAGSLSMLIISHDLSAMSEFCDRIAVMYAGSLVEIGDTRSVFRHPSHPYTVKLMNSYPNIYGARDVAETMPGHPPDLLEPAAGCPFFERCPSRMPRCGEERPSLAETGRGHFASCLRAGGHAASAGGDKGGKR